MEGSNFNADVNQATKDKQTAKGTLPCAARRPFRAPPISFSLSCRSACLCVCHSFSFPTPTTLCHAHDHPFARRSTQGSKHSLSGALITCRMSRPRTRPSRCATLDRSRQASTLWKAMARPSSRRRTENKWRAQHATRRKRSCGLPQLAGQHRHAHRRAHRRALENNLTRPKGNSAAVNLGALFTAACLFKRRFHT